MFVKQQGRIRLFSMLAFLLLVAALAVSGNRITASLLDDYLPPLLSEQLGIPVSIEPVSARLLNLQVTTPRLVMGSRDKPAIDARDVLLTLDWPALLKGDIRFEHVEAADLLVDISRWPTGSDPWPKEYHFLDPWLPSSLNLKQGRYQPASGDPWQVQTLEVLRQTDGGMAFNWSEQRPDGELGLTLTLRSLYDLLDLARLQLDLALSGAAIEKSTVEIKLDIHPASAGGFELAASIDTPHISGKVSASNTQAWTFPATSSIKIKSLDPAQAAGLVRVMIQQGKGEELHEFLESPLPDLELPIHTSQVSIDDIHLNDEVLLETRAEIKTGEQGLIVSNLQSQGPAAIFTGSVNAGRLEAGWALTIATDIKARGDEQGIAPKYLDADWLWRSGHWRLQGSGNTWESLLYQLEGELALKGSHRGTQDTPVEIKTQLKSGTDAFAMDAIHARIGDNQFTGSLSLSGDKRKRLALKLRGDELDLRFLFSERGAKPTQGLPIPEYLGLFTKVDVNWDVDIGALRFPALTVKKLKVAYDRTPELARLTASAHGARAGKLGVELKARGSASGKTSLNASVALEKLDLRTLFDDREGGSLFKSRSSGQLTLSSHGDSVPALFEQLKGSATLTIAIGEDDKSIEQLSLKSDAALVVEKDTILGVSLSGLKIDSLDQDLTGTLSMVAGRSPWIVAKLKAERLDLDHIAEWAPKSAADVDQRDLLQVLRDLGPISVSMDTSSLRWLNTPVSDLHLSLLSGRDSFSVEKLDLKTTYGQAEASMSLNWIQDIAHLKGAGTLRDFEFDHFLGKTRPEEQVPVSGSLELNSQGTTFLQLAHNLAGQVSLLSSEQPQVGQNPRRKLELSFRREGDVYDIDLAELRREESYLQGKLRYHDAARPEIDITISGGNLQLAPWEQTAEAGAEEEKSSTDRGTLTGIARTSGRLARRVLEAPIRMFSESSDSTPGDRYFSDDPLDLDFLNKVDGSLTATLEAINGEAGESKNVVLSGTLREGKLEMEAKGAELNGGPSAIKASLDWASPDRPASFQSTFEGVYSSPRREGSPNSGFVSLTSRGSSQAELAANLDGQVFLKLGPGPLGVTGLAFLTSDLSTGMIRRLIPGSEKQTPELRCAVTVAQFQDGMMVTPYGYAAQTRRANLIGRMQVDLKQETLRLQFDSRSRSGVGISVGNVFSNTIVIEGPLTKPSVKPRTTGLLWRGWAAVMTAGMSIIGESVVKRALAAKDPCSDIFKEIQKTECSSQSLLSGSAMVCPAAG